MGWGRRQRAPRFGRQTVLDQLDSEGHSDVVDAYLSKVKHGRVDYKDESRAKNLAGQTGSHAPGQGGAYR